MVCRKTLDCARLMFALCKRRRCMMEIKLSTVRRQKETSRESLKDSGSCLELNLTLKNLTSQIYQKRFFLFIDRVVSLLIQTPYFIQFFSVLFFFYQVEVLALVLEVWLLLCSSEGKSRVTVNTRSNEMLFGINGHYYPVRLTNHFLSTILSPHLKQTHMKLVKCRN